MGTIEITKEIEEKCCVHRGVKGSPAPIPQEGEWTKCKEIKDISGLTHGCGCCAPQQGTCKLTLNATKLFASLIVLTTSESLSLSGIVANKSFGIVT